jgi:uncharacterized integral membrane protein
MKLYPCSQIPEFDWLVSQKQLKAEILQKFEREDQQLEEAIRLVNLHVIKRIPYRSQSGLFIARLKQQEIKQNDIVNALAQAWLQESQEFRLPKKKWQDFVKSTWVLLIISFILSLLLLILGVKIIRHINPELDAYLLAFPPLLAIVGFFLVSIIFALLYRLAKIYSRVFRE